MEDDFNYKCNKLKQDLEIIINESNMPIGAVYFIFKDVFSDIEKTYIAYLNSISISNTKKEVLYDSENNENDTN